ncbi:MAG TPA: hypothetical protein DCY13_15170 [Verrucomicrobiales bacterium]|nr:hypothetical protein [Verrucomicrobiales bacterium]
MPQNKQCMGLVTEIGAGLAAMTLLGVGIHGAGAEEDDLAEMLGDLSLWDQSFNLRLGAGHNDNLLLSNLNEESSPMLVSGFDLTLFRLPIDGNHLNFFASLDDRRYPEGQAVPSEQTVLAVAQARRDFSEAWLGGLTGQYFYQNQVVDASLTEADVTTLPVQGHQFVTTTDWRWRSHSVWWLQADLSGQRQLFEQELLDDYWQYGPKLSLGWNYRHKSDVELGYEFSRRDYASREQYTAGGLPVAGTRLHYLNHGVELAWRHHFDEAQRWRLYSRLGWSRNEDNGSGYFNFDRYLASSQLRYRNDPWEVRLQARITWYEYDLQRSDVDPNDERQRTLVSLGARLERKISRAVRLVAEYDFEQAVSNLSFDEYTANVVSLGMDWQF